jgi:Ca-activated chloride channel family protein
MRRSFFFKRSTVTITFIVILATLFLTNLKSLGVVHATTTTTQKAAQHITQGSLQALAPSGKLMGLCPLKHTAVKAEVAGFLSRVTVTQEFENNFKEKIEAVYTFPLPQAAAVDDMTMLVGDRTVKGKIMRREEAQAAYAAAKSNGQVASLLDQERPNIFTQAVANILPGERVTITISYVETLKYENGTYEFTFPMVVSPRYIPEDSAAPQGEATQSEATTEAPSVPADAARLNPPAMPEGVRAGHDISIEVALDAGVLLDGLTSPTHEIEVERPDNHQAIVRLKDQATIPNKDFVFKYDVAGRRIEDALISHRTNGEGFFTLILQPPDSVAVEDVTPKELVFVLDTSGSMQGFPLEKAKETVNLALDHLYPQDTFNLITFSGDTHVLFDEPVVATPDNLRKAKKFLESRKSDGGTEMMKAIRAALKPSDAQSHLRIACFMTDGQVGNDMEIIAEVQKYKNARVFSIGFGSAPNRFLLDKMAEYGRGEVEYVTETEDNSLAARRFFERVRNPLLTDISIEWAGVSVTDVYPKTIPDLFSAKPVILSGRYAGGGSGLIRLKGKMSGQAFAREIPVNLPETEARHGVLASLWARRRIDDLMGQDMNGMQAGQMRADLRESITSLGLQYRLMTQFTSFVAIEDRIVTGGGGDGLKRVDVSTEAAAASGSIASGAISGTTGGVNASVTVTANYAVINSTASNVTSTVESRMVRDLPLNNRSMLPFLYLAPGVAPPTNQLPDSSPARIAVNGQRPGSNNYMIDGVSADVGISPSQSSGTSPAATLPALTVAGGTSSLVSIEGTQEITIKTFNIEPQYGRVPGAQVSVVTRSGTNEFHGSLFEYLDNEALDANDWFANSRRLARAPHRQNIFGGTLGGPVKKDKTFFFFSYEGLRLRQPLTGITDVPSLESRLAAPPALQPFLNAFPLPTASGRADGLAEFASTFTNPVRHDTASIRLDSNLNERVSLFGRYNFASSEAENRGSGLFSLNTLEQRRNRTQTLTAGANIINSPSVITELRFNYSRVTEVSASQPDDFGGAIVSPNVGQLDFLAPNRNNSSIFDLNGRNAALKSAGAISSTQRQLNALGSVSIVINNHTLKFGGDWRRLAPILHSYTQEQRALFNGIASVMTGAASRINLFSRAEETQPVFHNLSIYGQDEWRITPHFSLTYGLRWELAPAPNEHGGQAVLAATAIDDPSRLTFAPLGAPLWQTTYNNFEPRASLAYELSRTSGSETLLRAGVSLFHDTVNEAAGSFFTDSYPHLTGQTVFNAPFPAIPAQGAVTLAPTLSVPFVAFDPQLKLPYTLQWNVSLERALGDNQRIALAYVGAMGRRLLLTQTFIEPNPDFSFVRLVTNDARSSYKSLQLQFDKRFSSGLQALITYTLAKSEDDVAEDSIYRAMLLSPDRRLDRAASDFDIRHQLAGSVSYSLPALFDSGIGNTLSRNWTINSLFYARSARPLNVVYAVPTSVGFAYLRPDLVESQPLYVTDPAAGGGRRINADAFSIPPFQRQGTLDRNALRGFAFSQIDVGLGRKFMLTEDVELHFRVEAFNLLNHPNFEDPLGNDLSLGSRLFGSNLFLPNTTFGQSASLSGRSLWTRGGGSLNSAYGNSGSRSIRFSLRLQF